MTEKVANERDRCRLKSENYLRINISKIFSYYTYLITVLSGEKKFFTTRHCDHKISQFFQVLARFSLARTPGLAFARRCHADAYHLPQGGKKAPWFAAYSVQKLFVWSFPPFLFVPLVLRLPSFPISLFHWNAKDFAMASVSKHQSPSRVRFRATCPFGSLSHTASRSLRSGRDIREFKHDVYGRRQTAKITSDFVFFCCNP